MSGLLLLAAGLVVPSASASSTVDACVPVYQVGQQSLTVCVNPANVDCPVLVRQSTGWISYAYCVPPEAASGAAAVDCVTVYDFPDAGYKLCPTLDNPNCLLWEEVTTFTGTERRCLVPRP